MSTAMRTHSNLKTAGLKTTKPRLKILNLFDQSEVRHMSADDVYHALISEGFEIGLATVYRVLTQFENVGLLIRHHFDNGRSLYELNQGGHHGHIMCLQCGRVEEFYDSEIEKRQNKIAQDLGFTAREHSHYLYGDCIRTNCPYEK
jgi:Fur family transcriptional regulator, ferric uptake regulator